MTNKNYIKIVLICFGFIINVKSLKAQTSGVSAPPISGYGTPLFIDEFNGTKYDTAAWVPRVGSRFNNLAVNLPANNVVDSGYLNIRFKNDQGGNGVYSCGGLITKKAFGYGYYEARIKLFLGSAGLHQSFWQLGASNSALYNMDLIPANNAIIENDATEADSRDGVAKYNNHSYVPVHASQGGVGMGTYTSWFTIGYEWLPDRVDFYINGVKKGSKSLTSTTFNVYAQQPVWLTAQYVPTCPYPQTDSRWWYDFGGNQPLTDPNAKMQIDYFKYYSKPFYDVNLIANPSFEYTKINSSVLNPQSIACWIETKTVSGFNPNASLVESSSVAHSGSYQLSHSSSTDYLTETKQILSFIPNGLYKLTAWVKGSNHVIPAKMRVIGCGTTIPELNIPQSNDWVQVTIYNINVTNNQAIISFISNAKANEWIKVDDVVFKAIAQKEFLKQSISFDNIPTKTYGNAPFNLNATATSGLPVTYTSSDNSIATINGNQLTILKSGQCTITANQAGDDLNLPATPVSQNLTITPAPLTIAADKQTKNYGDNNPTLTYKYTGFVNGDDSTSFTNPVSISTTATATSGVGTYPITVSGATAANYVITFVPGTLAINQAPLTITADSLTKNYGDNNPTLTYKYTGFVNGDDATKLITPVSINTTAAVASPVGHYPITASGATAANYVITFIAGTLTINQAPLTITADNLSKHYSDDNPPLTYKYAGFVNNEDATVLITPVAISTTATTNSAAGTYSITVSGATAANYAITFIAGTLTINPAPAPTITAVDNLTVTAGSTVNLTGTYFLGATAVSFGGTASTSFTVNSATSITAVVGNGASGIIAATTPSGSGTFEGFKFVPVPSIATSGPTTILSDGDGVTLTASPASGGYTYQWQNNGVNITGATNPTYTTTQTGKYRVIITLNGVSQTSVATPVTAVYALPATNFTLTITSETCIGSGNGTVVVTAVANNNYTVVLTGNGVNIAQKFTTNTTFGKLTAGSYTLTLTVDGQANYSSTYAVVVTQPQPLSVFAKVNNVAGNIDLALSGGTVYHIQVNNKTYTTTESSFSVPLEQGNNALQVTTDRECQGIFSKLINPSLNITPYPIPFESTLNLNLGSDNIEKVSVKIYSTNTGMQVYTADYQNQSGVLQLDLSKLAKGVYSLHLILNNNQQEFKVIK